TVGFDVESVVAKAISEIVFDDQQVVVTSVDFTAETVGQEKTIGKVTSKVEKEVLAKVAVSQHRHNTAALKAAGYTVDTILDDATVKIDDGDFIMSAANPSKKIGDFLDYIKTNPIMVKEMTIVSSDKAAFSTDMEVATLNPFKRNPEELIDINKFFSKYQQVEDRIDIQFDQPLEISDVLLWTMNVPDGAKMQITLRF
ncbi:MAG: hypothetical protein PHE56_13105, partial [Bacteroidales bacterium]|nr:hypothetical protein [Bacteroidales bacterium]